MHGIIHHMHSGSGDAPDEHGGETHRLYFAVYFNLVLDQRSKIGILKMVCDNWEVRGEGLSFCRVFPRESMTDVTTCDTLF